ncbi:MAG: hypothetical protein ACLU48_09265 [Clostridiaceae bacterium]
MKNGEDEDGSESTKRKWKTGKQGCSIFTEQFISLTRDLFRKRDQKQETDTSRHDIRIPDDIPIETKTVTQFPV